MREGWVAADCEGRGTAPLQNATIPNSLPASPPTPTPPQVGAEMGCSNEVLTVVSMLSVPSVFFRPPDR